MNRITAILLCLVAACAAGGAMAEQRVAEFTGNESTVTRVFEVEAPWIIDWGVASEYRSGTSIEVWLINADDESNLGYVVTTTGTGDGVKLFEEGGHFYLRVNSALVDWRLTVKTLTPDEARQYTPRD